MNIINNFLNGQIILWKTFWGGIVITLILPNILNFLFGGYADLFLWFFIFILYLLIASGVCRSANNYSGSMLWSFIAKLFFCLFFLVFIMRIFGQPLMVGILKSFGDNIIMQTGMYLFIPWIVISFFLWFLKPKQR